MLKISKKQIKDIKKGVKNAFKTPLNGSITIRCDENLKKDAMRIFNNVGLDLSTAINIFLKKSVAFGGVPFVVKDDSLKKGYDSFLLAREQALKNKPEGMTLDEINELIQKARK